MLGLGTCVGDFLGQFADRKAQVDVCPHLSGVDASAPSVVGIPELESAKFDGRLGVIPVSKLPGKSWVKVSKMIPAVIVMGTSTEACSVSFVPAICELPHCPGLLAVDPFQEGRIHQSAIASGPSLVNLDRPSDLRLMRGHDIHQIAQRPGVVIPSVRAFQAHMQVDSAAAGRRTAHARVPKLPQELQERLDIAPEHNGRHEFALLIIRSRDAAIALELIFASLLVIR